MVYLTTMPECIDYINELKLEAFSLCLKQISAQWVNSTLQELKKKGIGLEEINGLYRILRFISEEYIVRKFDRFWHVASTRISTNTIAKLLNSSFRSKRLIKADVLNNVIRAPKEQFERRGFILQQLAELMKVRGINMEMSPLFFREQLYKYKEIATESFINYDDYWI